MIPIDGGRHRGRVTYEASDDPASVIGSRSGLRCWARTRPYGRVIRGACHPNLVEALVYRTRTNQSSAIHGGVEDNDTRRPPI